MTDEPERRRDVGRVADQLGFLRADLSLMSSKIDRLDDRTARMEKALFYGNGQPALATQVAVNGERLREVHRQSSRAGAMWGVASGAVVTALANIISLLSQNPPQGPHR